MKKLFLIISILSSIVYAGAPFLSQGLIPHYTKKIAMNWDNDFLELSDEQKPKLIKIREDTMREVGKLKELLAPLEQELADRILKGEKPESLRSLVKKIADYKSEATMVHLQCVYKTQEVLTKDQLDLLPSL
jgi:hypothetical protein